MIQNGRKNYKGVYTPINPAKYRGDYKNIIYRSSWEKKVMLWLDKNPSVVSWSSEEIIVPYKSPVDGRFHRYFVDFYAQVKSKDGKLKSYLLEVKPLKQATEPKPKSRVTKQYINEVATWGVNQAKWKAATEYCADRGWEFKILTEEHLNL
jgi:hypothetical protein